MLLKFIFRNYRNQFNTNLNKKWIDFKSINLLKDLFNKNHDDFNCINYSTLFKILKNKKINDNELLEKVLLKFNNLIDKEIEFIDNNRSLSNLYFYINSVYSKEPNNILLDNVNKNLEKLILIADEEFNEDEIYMIMNISYNYNKEIFEKMKLIFFKNLNYFSLKSFIIISFNLIKWDCINKDETKNISNVIVDRIPKIKFYITQDISNILYIISYYKVEKEKKIYVLNFLLPKIENQMKKDPNGLFTSSILYKISKFKEDELLDKDFYNRIENDILIKFIDKFSMRTIVIILRSYVLVNLGSKNWFDKIDEILIENFNNISLLDKEIVLNFAFKTNKGTIKLKEKIFDKLQKFYYLLFKNKVSLNLLNIEKILIGFLNVKNKFNINPNFEKLLYYFIYNYIKNIKNWTNFEILSLISISYLNLSNEAIFDEYKLFLFNKIIKAFFESNLDIKFNHLFKYIKSFLLIKKLININDKKIYEKQFYNIIIEIFNKEKNINKLFEENNYEFLNNFTIILEFIFYSNLLTIELDKILVKNIKSKKKLNEIYDILNIKNKEIWINYVNKNKLLENKNLN